MASELKSDRPVGFFCHLGDIVYLYGERAHYRAQFFEPYAGYGAPIMAIAGNHDGDVEPGSGVPSLDAFAGQFCAPPTSGRPVTPAGRSASPTLIGRSNTTG
jgi:predicted phosphodiesterase